MSKETPKKQTYEELTKDLDKKYQDKAKPNIFKAVLIPFKAIRDAFRFVADVIRFRLLIPKEERMNFGFHCRGVQTGKTRQDSYGKGK